MQNAAILWHVSLLVPGNQKGLALGLVGLVRILPIIAKLSNRTVGYDFLYMRDWGP